MISASSFWQLADFKEVVVIEEAEVRLRLSAQEERGLRRDGEDESLQCKVARKSRAQESTVAAVVRLSLRKRRKRAVSKCSQEGKRRISKLLGIGGGRNTFGSCTAQV
jgi:hypothetical protein